MEKSQERKTAPGSTISVLLWQTPQKKWLKYSQNRNVRKYPWQKEKTQNVKHGWRENSYIWRDYLLQVKMFTINRVNKLVLQMPGLIGNLY